MEEEVDISLKGIHVIHQDGVCSWLMSLRNILHNLVKYFVKFINGFIFISLMLVKSFKINQTSLFSNHLSKKTFWHA
jgi:hypothetical protein